MGIDTEQSDEFQFAEVHIINDITLTPLENEDRGQFIPDNREAFNYGALEEFSRGDDHFEEEGRIISRETIEKSIGSWEAHRLMIGNEKLGSAVIKVDGGRGDLELLFVSPKVHGNDPDDTRPDDRILPEYFLPVGGFDFMHAAY